ncbi:hypothetical protein [Haloarchaeobius sp. DT45]|uniref:hypothetical protein n=1 Tax=Haloarchaeobius sp. DT45 TaxID=3446116 RepID=UPI003F6BA83A
MSRTALKAGYGFSLVLAVAYAILTRQLLLGFIIATIPVGFYLAYLTLQLFQRLVVALERIAENTDGETGDRLRTDGATDDRSGTAADDSDEERSVSKLFE